MIEYERNLSLPDLTQGTPDEIWDAFFSKHRPDPETVRRWVLSMHREKQHRQVIACLEAALIHGQSQPWMYEVLALSMEIENYPKESVERVVMSLNDFGEANYESMIYSAAYLTRFGRKRAALNLYQQCSRIAPDRPEPYLLGLKLARELGDARDVEWAATGTLTHAWGKDYVRQHRDAENALLEAIRQRRLAGETDLAEGLKQKLAEAKAVDLEIRVEWSGKADLDLFVEEPGGSICSFEVPMTAAGGLHQHDGAGTTPQDSYELYVAPRALAGPYRIVVRSALGEPVGGRATVTVIKHKGQPSEEKIQRTLVLEGEEARLNIDLDSGRRSEPRPLSFLESKKGSEAALACL